MTLRSTVFDSSGSRVASLGDTRLNVQISIDEEAETETQARPELVKCPELLLTGMELETRTTLRILHKKGRRFESPWEPFFVGVYAHTLFYYANLGDWPRGVIPLADAEVKAVDRIFRHGDASCDGDDCGPCWKVTSSSGRVLLFRAPSYDARLEWIEQLRQATGTFRKVSMDGKAALALARRLSRSSSSASSTSASSTVILQSPRHRRRKRMSEDDSEQTEMLRDALRMVEKQRKEIEELQKRLKKFETKDKELQKAGESENEQIESDADEEIDLDTMLDGDAIEICTGKVFRGSAISDVLSEDDDTSSTEGDDNDADGEKESVGVKREEGRENIQSLSLVDESMETLSNHEDELDTQEGAEIETEISSSYEEAPSSLKQESAPVAEYSKQQPLSMHPKQDNTVSIKSPKRDKMPVPEPESERTESTSSSWSSKSTNCCDAVEKDSIQQQATELAEMARNMHKDDTDSASTRESSEDGSFFSSFKGSNSGTGVFDSCASSGNDFLQQQAMELAEIARNLQSSFRLDPKPSKISLKTSSSSSSLFESQSSLSDVTDFGLNQINSNESNESIFSITQDDLFFDEDEEGEIERLSEFEASDSQFLEASGFLDSIHQVMKDFIVSSQPDQSRQPDQLVISDEIIAEIRQGIDAEPSKRVDDLDEAHRQRALRSDSPATDSSNDTSPRIRSLFSHARSARDFFNGDIEMSVRAPKDLPSLVVEETMSVVASILQSAGREDKMLSLAPFLRVFGSRNRLSHLIRWAIEIEVASVINVATLFRSDDYASRLVSTYSKAIGSKFIRVALSDPIRQIFKLKIADMELNPHKEESLQDETQVDTNAANLMRTCQNIIDSIVKNTHCIPSSYFHICSHLNSKVISRFDGSKEGVEAEDASTLTRSVIGGFLFLRFVCPAITTPHLYGLTKQLPPPETRRVLVLVTKLLFKTATGVKFGDREPQFKVLNPFIEKNSPAIQQLFANLAMSPSQDIDECFASDSRKIYSNVSSSQLVEDLETIRSISEKNLEEISKKLEDCDSALEVAENFKSAVLYTTDSFQKSSLTKKLSANMKFLSGFGKKPRSRKQSDQ
ncbi:hypothetical protein PInf_012634 [Phytophthora infestans]|nr:hypothetical protein PInf_012634 [Phytophthora infestans]